MSESKNDISLSSDIEDDNMSNLVIDHMNVNEIAEYIDMNYFQKLSKDLSNASTSCGFNVVRNGTRQ